MEKRHCKLRAGIARCTIVTRLLRPRQLDNGNQTRQSEVVLVGQTVERVSKKNQDCYKCTKEGAVGLLHAVRLHFVIVNKGPMKQFFAPLTVAELEAERQSKYSSGLKEPKKKW